MVSAGIDTERLESIGKEGTSGDDSGPVGLAPLERVSPSLLLWW